ncbi:hypothetical protein ACFXTH_022340 [Malus domestica]
MMQTEYSQLAAQSQQQQQLVVHNSVGSLSFNSNMSKEDEEMSRSTHAPMLHISHTSHSPQALGLSILAWPLARASPEPHCLYGLELLARAIGLERQPVHRAIEYNGAALKGGGFSPLPSPPI